MSLRVQPGAAKTEPAGRYGESALRLRLVEPARDGRANKGCVRFLAQSLGVPPTTVAILHGEGARDKLVRIGPVSEGAVLALLKKWGC